MTHPLRGGLSFSPTLEEFARERAGSTTTVLSGGNNSGKSLVLKWLKSTMGRTSYMVGSNRFYHVYHFNTSIRDPNELDQYENQFQSNFWSEQFNYEQNFIDLNRIILGLSDSQRESLFELCGRLIGSPFTLKRAQEDNELSARYIDVGGQNLSVASTGTRLLLTILGICMDDRFKTLLIDEPELGLSPKVQSALAGFIHNATERAKYFPHLRQVILATHSQLFLNRLDIGSNYIVGKNGVNIELTRVRKISDLHRLQFNLLGNSLESLFLPSAVIYVEGPSDLEFLGRVIELRYPGKNIIVIPSNGDPKQKIHSLREALGDLRTSPLQSRIFVVVDSIHSSGLRAELLQMGLAQNNFVAWNKNGVEYVYPSAALAEIFRCRPEDVAALALEQDIVRLNGIEKRKLELAKEVSARVNAQTTYPEELELLLRGITEAVM